MDKVWKKVLSEIQLEVSPATFATLFKKTELMSINKGVAIINCPSPMLSNLIETRYYALLKKILDKHLNLNTSIVLGISSSSKNTQNNGLRKEKRNWLKLLKPDKKIAFNASIFILISLSLFFAFFFCLLGYFIP